MRTMIRNVDLNRFWGEERALIQKWEEVCDSNEVCIEKKERKKERKGKHNE
jgi:hypothetical protein